MLPADSFRTAQGNRAMDLQTIDRAVLLPTGSHTRRAIRRAVQRDFPSRHWVLHDLLAADLCRALIALDTQGRRRFVLSATAQQAYPACAALAEAFQDEATAGLIQDRCDVLLAGSLLRIECCLGTPLRWHAPAHQDGSRRFTILVSLVDEPGDRPGCADAVFNAGVMFEPGADAWRGLMCPSLIVDYVNPGWQPRHELAFPETPIAAD
jgi:hypothetical protein